MFLQPLAEALRYSDDDRRTRCERYAAGVSGICFVASYEAEFIGMVFGFLDESRGSAARVGGMWVAPHARRFGAGRKLLAAVRDWARERRRTELRLHVFKAGRDAQSFYRSQGFSPVSSEPDDDGFVEYESRGGNLKTS